MALSDVKTDGSWIKTYDEKGKHMDTMSSSGKEVVGIGSDFFVCMDGSWIKTYDEKCKHLDTMSSSGKIVRAAAGMMSNELKNRIFIAGGFIRSVILRENINDIDIYVEDKDFAWALAKSICHDEKSILTTRNTYTINGRIPIQVNNRYINNSPNETIHSFDFTIDASAVFWTGEWNSICDDRFYVDLVGRWLVYKLPLRKELNSCEILKRAIKFTSRGYRIRNDSLALICSQIVKEVDQKKMNSLENQDEILEIIRGLFYEREI